MADTFNYLDTVLSQFANSPTLLSLIGSFSDAVNPSANIDAFYDSVWNIQTATGFGLDVWGRITGIGRVLSIPGANTDFGFEEAAAQPFNQGPFYYGVLPTQNYTLSDDAFRALILIKALANISNCSIQTYNTILMQLFPNRGNAYVMDNGNMTMTIVCQFPLQPFEISILTMSGAFVAPTGVGMQIMVLDVPNQFGFAESGAFAQGFGHGTFWAGYS